MFCGILVLLWALLAFLVANLWRYGVAKADHLWFWSKGSPDRLPPPQQCGTSHPWCFSKCILIDTCISLECFDWYQNARSSDHPYRFVFEDGPWSNLCGESGWLHHRGAWACGHVIGHVGTVHHAVPRHRATNGWFKLALWWFEASHRQDCTFRADSRSLYGHQCIIRLCLHLMASWLIMATLYCTVPPGETWSFSHCWILDGWFSELHGLIKHNPYKSLVFLNHFPNCGLDGWWRHGPLDPHQMNRKMERVESRANVVSVSEIFVSASWALESKHNEWLRAGLFLKAREMVTALKNQKIEGFVWIKKHWRNDWSGSATTRNRSQRFTDWTDCREFAD